MTCEHCGGSLPTTARCHARTCSTRCRVAAHRARKRAEAQPYPTELTSRDRWVRRTARKVPLQPDGRAASSTSARTWSTYAACTRSTVGVGVGFVLNGDGIVCVDLDHCIDEDGQVAPWAQAILDACPPTFVEVSASGSGLHVWGRGHVGVGRRIRRDDVAVEVYDRGRYIAMGTPVAGAPLVLGDLSGVLATLA